MKKQLVWRITSISDKETENPIDTPVAFERMKPRYFLHSAVAGRGAILVNLDDHKQSLQTSRIQELIIFGDRIKITTLNTIYWLKQSIEDVE
ncbi:hypothetical protein PQE68_gp168 [Bacillus phage vB_BanS_Sophrita]|uniref:Uncharacterized protein n=1 Tax=Bacillus phage vB_BanS_Sophrita TaxID=2894790 RepID=A0AAE9CDW3_9CAUD|nr:hypothetical protein PQE68_gp168 [Bacillus phage vB_BanS_Sophrita]UGO50759.1 hypothetical protein SOPHRITA_168 [Bacillus phage vB_BanS_Sophrita]